MPSRILCALLMASAALVNCGETSPEGATRTLHQPERWQPQDDPADLQTGLQYQLDALPVQGEVAAVPWAGCYWPTSKDSVNLSWQGSLTESAVAKYSRAFGVDTPQRVEDAVSSFVGIDSVNSTSCTRNSQCDSASKEVCAFRAGEGSGRCVPTWFGLCHAWVSASILEPEPIHPVSQNGVTFQVNDLKALVTLMYHKSSYDLISGRCNLSDQTGQVQYDAFGRPLASECRDTNPGTFHLTLVNFVGVKKKSFGLDRVFDSQVWNHPIRGYRVLQSTSLSRQQAAALVGETTGEYSFNRAAVGFRYIKNRVRYITESFCDTDGNLSARIDQYTEAVDYEYVLELDTAGKIIGGEWTAGSKLLHPDFLWVPLARSAIESTPIAYKNVQELLRRSVDLATDRCPDDPAKTEPGVCGCAVAETDTDGDHTPDCLDGCPKDPGKIRPGACGCATPDLDSDGDGAYDCQDSCPLDPQISSGPCSRAPPARPAQTPAPPGTGPSSTPAPASCASAGAPDQLLVSFLGLLALLRQRRQRPRQGSTPRCGGR